MTPTHDHNNYDHTPTVDRIEVTRVQFHRGTGCCQESPVRIVTAYYQPDGSLLVEDDPNVHARHVVQIARRKAELAELMKAAGDDQ